MLHQQYNENYIIPNEISSQNLPPPPSLITTDIKFEYPPILDVSSSPEHPLLLQHHMSFPQPPPVFSPFPPSPLLTHEIIVPQLPLQDDQLYYPEFRQYDKEKYESSKSDGNNCSRRRRQQIQTQIRGEEFCDTASSLDGYEDDDIMNINNQLTHAEMRRQMHIQSEQKRRAEIKDGFDDLLNQLPIPNHGRKMSKALLLQK
ncbi:11626_t:CDS:2, partial [Entrophospora sp. SA101]